MRKLISLFILLVIVTSCNQSKYTHIGQEILNGKVSATEHGYVGRFPTLPKIWVQTPTKTREISIPFDYENKWKVGDSILVIVEQYKENE